MKARGPGGRGRASRVCDRFALAVDRSPRRVGRGSREGAVGARAVRASDATHSRVASPGARRALRDEPPQQLVARLTRRWRNPGQASSPPVSATARCQPPIPGPNRSIHARRGEHHRLDCVAQFAAGWRDRAQLGIQRVRPPRRARTQALCAAPGGAQPPTDRSRRTTQPAGDHPVPDALACERERLADHLRAVAPARDRPRRQQHVRRAAPTTHRPAWPQRPYLVGQPHLARARVPPR